MSTASVTTPALLTAEEFAQRPNYLGIGIEVNEIYLAGPNKWRAYAALHRHVCQELKRDHPDLPSFTSFTLHGAARLRVAGPRREGTPRLHGVETVLRSPSCQVIGGPDPRRGHRVILALFFGPVNHQSPCPASHSKSGCITQSTTHFPSSWVKQTIPALRNLTTSISELPVSKRLTKRLR